MRDFHPSSVDPWNCRSDVPSCGHLCYVRFNLQRRGFDALHKKKTKTEHKNQSRADTQCTAITSRQGPSSARAAFPLLILRGKNNFSTERDESSPMWWSQQEMKPPTAAPQHSAGKEKVQELHCIPKKSLSCVYLLLSQDTWKYIKFVGVCVCVIFCGFFKLF